MGFLLKFLLFFTVPEDRKDAFMAYLLSHFVFHDDVLQDMLEVTNNGSVTWHASSCKETKTGSPYLSMSLLNSEDRYVQARFNLPKLRAYLRDHAADGQPVQVHVKFNGTERVNYTPSEAGIQADQNYAAVVAKPRRILMRRRSPPRVRPAHSVVRAEHEERHSSKPDQPASDQAREGPAAPSDS